MSSPANPSILSEGPSLRKELFFKAALFLCAIAGFLLHPPNLKEFAQFYVSSGWPDQGAQFLFALLVKAHQWLVPSHQANLNDVTCLQGIFILTLSLVLLVPRLAWKVSAGAQAGLILLWWIFDDISVNCHAIEAWAILLSATFIIVLASWKGSAREWIFCVLAGALLGYLPLMRQSTIGTILAIFAPLLFFGAVIVIRSYFPKQRSSSDAAPAPSQKQHSGGWSVLRTLLLRRQLVRSIPPILVLLCCAFVVKESSQRAWTAVYKTPFMTHGVGWSLFLSLGVSKNPYNVVYNDNFAVQQGLFIEGIPYLSAIEPKHLSKLSDVWKSWVLEDPALLPLGVISKAKYLVRYFSGTLDPLESFSDEQTLQPSWKTALLGCLFFVWFFYCGKLFLSNRSDAMTLLAAGSGGLIVGGFLPLLALVPYRLGSAIACILTLALIILPAAYDIFRKRSPHADDHKEQKENTGAWRLAMVLALLPFVPFTIYCLYRNQVNRRDALELLVQNPSESFQKLGRKFAQRFNRLKPQERTLLVKRLLEIQNSECVLKPASPKVDYLQLFTPVVGLVGDDVLCIAAHMSKDWKMTLPSRAQGPRNSGLLVLKNAEKFSGSVVEPQVPYNFMSIHDDVWDNSLYMFCLPIPPGTREGARFFGVGAFNYRDSSPQTGLVLDYISGGRLLMGTQAGH